MFQAKIAKKFRTHFRFNSSFFSESRAVCEIMWKNIGAGQATDDKMARAHCVLDN